MTAPIDTVNTWAVGNSGERVVMLVPSGSRLTPTEAKTLAAYLVQAAETAERNHPEVAGPSFEDVILAVRNA